MATVFVVACGGNIADGTGTARPGPSDGGLGMGGSSAGGSSGGSGGAVGGSAGVGAGGIDCSNVGCGPPYVCTEGCSAPCGCCPCAEGALQTIGGVSYVCSGGCYAPPIPPVDGGGAPCVFGGITYRDGQTFRAGDGCNTCVCSGGAAACTNKACQCNPASETHQRSYVGKSPSECAVIDFSCPANTTMFENACGCGCEQGVGCPDFFDCQPSPGVPPCDTNQIKTQCPYSGIAF